MSARDVLHQLGRILWREAAPFIRRRLVGVVVLVVAAGVLTGLAPVALKWIVDRLGERTGDTSVSPWVVAALYIAALWSAKVADQIRLLIFAQVRQRVLRVLSERLFAHLMQLPLRFHLGRQTGAVGQTLENGLEGLRMVLHHVVFTFLPVAVQVITMAFVIERLISAPFLLLFCSVVFLYAVTFWYSAATITSVAREASGASIDAAAAVTDGLLNYETVKYFTAEVLVQGRVAGAFRRAEYKLVSFYRRYSVSGLWVSGIFVVFVAGTVIYTTEEVRLARMTLGDFVLLNSYMLQIVQPVEAVGYGMQGMSHGVAMLERLVGLFREPTEVDVPGARPRAIGLGSLEFRDVRVSYGSGRPVLRNVSFRVDAGQTLGIVGPSGSGKSTVVRLLTRLLEPESGWILLDDVPISGLALQELRRSIAVVPQDTVLFDDTLRFNIALGRADASQMEIEEAGRVAQLHEFVMRLPEGYETVVGERGVKLSGGERQRVSIARAILKAPRIYIFDEATSSLDSATERDIVCSLRSISRLNTTVVIAHRLSTVVHANEIVLLESGAIVEQGTHHSLLGLNGRYAALWRAQQGGTAAA